MQRSFAAAGFELIHFLLLAVASVAVQASSDLSITVKAPSDALWTV